MRAFEEPIRAALCASKHPADHLAAPDSDIPLPSVPRMFRISTVAKILDISRQSVHAAVKRGDLPAILLFAEHEPASSTPDHPTKPRGAWRIKESDLLLYLAKCEGRK